MRRRTMIEPEAPPQIKIVPMIDVIFAMLTFFVMSTLALGRFEGFTVNLPKAQTAQPQKQVRATVTLDKQSKLYLNKSPIHLETLANSVKHLMQPGQEMVVVFNADGSVTHDRVVAAMEQIRQVPGAKLAIATQPPLKRQLIQVKTDPHQNQLHHRQTMEDPSLNFGEISSG